jgi:CheY-like chemotaxis protein/anti-sigma regulatory factor (Ser/Thr protein kinase)
VDQLIEAKEKAEESNRLKTAFLHNLSHEIRTPLNGILGFAMLLNDADLTTDIRQNYTQIIHDQGRQLESIIHDILTISALETGQERLFIERTNLRDLLNHHLSLLKEKAIHKRIRILTDITIGEADAMVEIDPSKINQILSNLLGNALKFTAEGEITLGCTLTENHLRFYVKDTGIGIDPRKHQTVFERFAQADDHIRRDFGGTGLGLSICRGLVKLMGGDISVESAPGVGSTFFFTIPVIVTPSAPVDKMNHPDTSSPSLPLTILVAEDEEVNFFYLKTLLESWNAKVIHAEHGQQAVDFCLTEQIDLVLMDIKMPGMKGDEATRYIKKMKPDLPVIAQTAHALQSEQEVYKELFDAYLIKPFTKPQLFEVLVKYMNISE